jgi:thioredoxin-dependent peroxiredoxin
MLKSMFLAFLPMLSLAAAGADLKPGMPAPAFEARDQEGRTIRLSDFAGKSTVVLYFYPKDDTPGCTAEACSLRDGLGAIQAAGAVVLGVSADDEASHKGFATKFNLPFSLLADPQRKIIEAYGVKQPVMGVAKRWTFIIDPAGTIRFIVQEVKTKEHDKQVLELLKSL